MAGLRAGPSERIAGLSFLLFTLMQVPNLNAEAVLERCAKTGALIATAATHVTATAPL
jgi:hypothetical protein